MDFEPLLRFSQVPGCDKLEIPGNDIFYEQIYFHFFIQSRPIRAEIRCLKRAFVIEIKQAHHGIEDIANKYHRTDAEGLQQVNIRVRCPAVLLRNGIKMSQLSKRGQVDLVFTLPGRVNREEIAVGRQIHERVLEKCRGALRHAGKKTIPRLWNAPANLRRNVTSSAMSPRISSRSAARRKSRAVDVSPFFSSFSIRSL